MFARFCLVGFRFTLTHNNNYYCVKYVFDTKRDSNLNNTCFANGVLQAVLSVERFLKGLQDIQHNREKCLAKQAGELWCFTTTLQP